MHSLRMRVRGPRAGSPLASSLVAARLLRAPGESARGAAREQGHRQRVPASPTLQVSVELVYPVLHGQSFEPYSAPLPVREYECP